MLPLHTIWMKEMGEQLHSLGETWARAREVRICIDGKHARIEIMRYRTRELD